MIGTCPNTRIDSTDCKNDNARHRRGEEKPGAPRVVCNDPGVLEDRETPGNGGDVRAEYLHQVMDALKEASETGGPERIHYTEYTRLLHLTFTIYYFLSILYSPKLPIH